MIIKRILYMVLIAVVAGVSALAGAVAGGFGAYQAVRQLNALIAVAFHTTEG